MSIQLAQIDLFCALIGLYNFGKQCGEEDTFDEATLSVESHVQTDNFEVISGGNKWMDKRRDDIAEQMWNDYQSYIQED